ncbi:pentapeptide repeat-containing protein [Streptomyces inhibens]|uniref:pentapeptide repeat-containing protein n=1 Tax=Streptomyces inhibens TaxID=2293571 RepID=UPI003CC92848|nr:pentapeptide repeat-containing protein [Streptomyces inhibens]
MTRECPTPPSSAGQCSPASTSEATFTGQASFRKATLGDAGLGGATFTGNALFDNATFTGDADFTGVDSPATPTPLTLPSPAMPPTPERRRSPARRGEG